MRPPLKQCLPPRRPLNADLHVGSGIYLVYSEHIPAIPIEKSRDPVTGDIMDMFMMGLLMLKSSNRSPLGCASCRAGQIPAAVAPVGAPKNGEGGMLRYSAVAAVGLLVALPALGQDPPAGAPGEGRGPVAKGGGGG